VRITKETTPQEIITMMVGRKLEDMYGQRGVQSIDEIMLDVRGLEQAGRLHNISFNVRKGEILGIAGLVGAGRTEMARAVFGVDPHSAGEIRINNTLVNVRSPMDAITAGLGYLPEDRKLQGLFLKMAIRVNISAANMGRISKSGFLQDKVERDLADDFVARLNIRTPSIDQFARNLSGGNQQKVVIAKWLAVQPKVLIMDEPTRGVDVGAKIEIYSLMHKMAREGVALVMISSELPEILGMSDRIVVVREGHLAGEMDRAGATEHKIMSLATGTRTVAEV